MHVSIEYKRRLHGSIVMSSTSFEHVLHNLQERDRIVDGSKCIVDDIFTHVRTDPTSYSPALSRALTGISRRIDDVYGTYKQTIERFNIGIVSFVSDYYSVADQHLDQFHPKYLHLYSGHKTHYNAILTTNAPESTFDVEELIDIFKEHCHELKHFKFHTDSSHMRRSRELTWAIYQRLSNFIASENVYDLADIAMREIELISTSLGESVPVKISDFHSLNNALKNSVQQFRNIKLEFKPSEEISDYCECGNSMQILAGSSEMVCDHCGFTYELKGTVFDDNQFYAQDGTRYKHAGYEPSKHCKAWLERIQARETNTITSTQLAKIEACIKRDGIANKKRITIEQLRRYLKDSGLTELNEHVALIKSLITGITPPQLTYSEVQDIANSFSKAVKAYNLIRPSNKSNLLFYPFLITKLVEMHVTDFNKRKSLLSFVHLQGTQTLIQNDQIWASICNAVPGFCYRPTDRYEYMD